MRIVEGDVLNHECFAHIVNQLCRKSHGLSDAVRTKFKWATVYELRDGSHPNLASETDRPRMGECIVKCRNEQLIFALVAQRDYGRPNLGRKGRSLLSDTREERLVWFRTALTTAAGLALNLGKDTLCLPHNIGCGLGFGDWESYSKVIDDVECATGIEMVLVKQRQQQR